MSKNEQYRRLIASKRWARLALELKTEAGWQCSRCGAVTQRLAVHHIRPVEMARTAEEMEARCFDRHNLKVLCFDCHSKEHNRSRTADGHQRTEDMRVQRFHQRDLHINDREPGL